MIILQFLITFTTFEVNAHVRPMFNSSHHDN